MKNALFATTLALACATVFAQTPGVTTEPGNATVSPKSAAAIEKKEDARKAGPGMAKATPETGAPGKAPMSAKTMAAADNKVEARKEATAESMKPMDANGDGMVSRSEYNNYHASMWKKMKMSKGSVALSDVQEQLKLGAAAK